MSSPTFSRTQLELYALGELGPDAQRELTAAMSADPSLAAHVATIQAQIDAASELPPLPKLPSLEEPLVVAPANNTLASWRGGWTRAALIAAAALLMAVALPLLFPPEGSTDVGTRYRGTFELSVVQERLGEAWSVGPLVTAHAGDHLQFTVTTPQDAWLMVYDVEDSGAVSTFQPPLQVAAGASTTLAVQLDDYSGSERIFVMVADHPIHEEDVAEEVNHEHRVPLAELDTFPHLPAAQRSILVLRDTP